MRNPLWICLMLAGALACGGDNETFLEAAAALELREEFEQYAQALRSAE